MALGKIEENGGKWPEMTKWNFLAEELFFYARDLKGGLGDEGKGGEIPSLLVSDLKKVSYQKWW